MRKAMWKLRSGMEDETGVSDPLQPISRGTGCASFDENLKRIGNEFTMPSRNKSMIFGRRSESSSTPFLLSSLKSFDWKAVD